MGFGWTVTRGPFYFFRNLIKTQSGILPPALFSAWRFVQVRVLHRLVKCLVTRRSRKKRQESRRSKKYPTVASIWQVGTILAYTIFFPGRYVFTRSEIARFPLLLFFFYSTLNCKLIQQFWPSDSCVSFPLLLERRGSKSDIKDPLAYTQTGWLRREPCSLAKPLPGPIPSNPAECEFTNA